MNVADSLRVASALEKLGYETSASPEQADVIVLNTCVVRQSAENKAYGRLQSLRPIKQRRPEVVINIMGCLVGVKGNPKLAHTFPYVDVFSPPGDCRPLIAYLTQIDGRSADLAQTKEINAIMDGDYDLPLDQRGTMVSAHVPVIHGCSHGCTFCVIPYRRGAERSRPEAEILTEVAALARQGVREINLLGQIVDRYGMDIEGGSSLAELLRSVHRVAGIERIRFLTSHPNWMTDRLLDAIAELPKVCEHIEVPIQSGDNQVLRRMKRGYSVEDYRRLIERIRSHLPGASIATDVIVGFPGETEEQFQHTYELLADLRLDVAHLARYSPRPDTVAWRRMQDDVSPEEKMRRFRALEELQAEIATEIHRRHLGRTVEVLVTDKHRGRWKGRTRTHKLVFFEAQGDMRGQLVHVRIDWTGPWSMRGQIVTEAGSGAKLPQTAATLP
jgi:tRNA-2-methylthio-N6-dimethylallyladenosine synthase